jgi:hypothetical protein
MPVVELNERPYLKNQPTAIEPLSSKLGNGNRQRLGTSFLRRLSDAAVHQLPLQHP